MKDTKQDAIKTWEDLKRNGGSDHYKTGGVEPVDLYKAKLAFKPFALCSIIKYATRNLDKDLNPKDLDKIIHYAMLLQAEKLEKDLKNLEERGKE